MAKFVYALNQSLDGYVDHMKFGGPPKPEVFRHFIQHLRGLAGLVYGHRMYEDMRYWDQDLAAWDADQRDYAALWQSRPKWVVSRTLTSVGPNATLLADDLVAAMQRLKAELAGEIGVGGPNLAQSLSEAGLIDVYQLYLHPVVLGGGKPFFGGPIPRLRLASSDLIAGELMRLTYIPA